MSSLGPLEMLVRDTLIDVTSNGLHDINADAISSIRSAISASPNEQHLHGLVKCIILLLDKVRERSASTSASALQSLLTTALSGASSSLPSATSTTSSSALNGNGFHHKEYDGGDDYDGHVNQYSPFNGDGSESTRLPQQCPFCPKQWHKGPPALQTFSRHVGEHPEVPGTFYRCSTCEFRFRSKQQWIEHQEDTGCDGSVIFDHDPLATLPKAQEVCRQRHMRKLGRMESGDGGGSTEDDEEAMGGGGGEESMGYEDDDDDYKDYKEEKRVARGGYSSVPYTVQHRAEPKTSPCVISKNDIMPAECPFCNKIFMKGPPSFHTYIKHASECHPDVPGTLYRCSDCEFRFRNFRPWQHHKKDTSCPGFVIFDHDPDGQLSQVQEDRRMRSAQQKATVPVREHIDRTGEIKESAFDDEDYSSSTSPKDAMPRECPFCEYVFAKGHPTFSTFVRHCGAHADVPGTFFRCSECEEFTFRGESSWRSHKEINRCPGYAMFDHDPDAKLTTIQEACRRREINKIRRRTTADDDYVEEEKEGRAVSITPTRTTKRQRLMDGGPKEEEPMDAEPANDLSFVDERTLLEGMSKCPECPYEFGVPSVAATTLYTHLVKCHPELKGSLFTCTECPTFRRRDGRSVLVHFQTTRCTGRPLYEHIPEYIHKSTDKQLAELAHHIQETRTHSTKDEDEEEGEEDKASPEMDGGEEMEM